MKPPRWWRERQARREVDQLMYRVVAHGVREWDTETDAFFLEGARRRRGLPSRVTPPAVGTTESVGPTP